MSGYSFLGKVLVGRLEPIQLGRRQLALPRDGTAASMVPLAYQSTLVLLSHCLHAYELDLWHEVPSTRGYADC
jgi:hypothetical protein